MISAVPGPAGPSFPANAPSRATLEGLRDVAFVDPQVICVPRLAGDAQRELDALLECARMRPDGEVRGPLASMIVDSQPRLQRLPQACVFAWRPTEPAIYYLCEPGATRDDSRFAHLVVDNDDDDVPEVWVSGWKDWRSFDQQVVRLEQAD